ncbi:MAG: Gfo/Idh/MocA family oxidoreductase [bacterium]|nr:Gfo/Idh/MocA family oxidoreductase [bacterium]
MPRKMTDLSRRTFLKSSAAAAVAIPMFVPSSAFGANDKINLAWVGFNAQGWGDLKNAVRYGGNVVALADVDQRVLDRGTKSYKDAKPYKDFRKMFAEMGDKIDAVGVGTPDHTHFAITYMAMSMGKHVFVEKPLAHSLWEIRELQKLAAKKGVVTQMGNQGHSFEGARLVKEWYQAGLIGDVKEIITWTNRPKRGYGFSGQVQTAYPKAAPIPGGLDWDLWLGPVTKKIGFSKEFHPKNWRPWWDFGCGGLGDIGCHTIDTPYWAMDLGNPTRVEIEMHGKANNIYTPNGSVVTYKFPARGKQPAATLKWYEGPTMPKAPEGFDGKMSGGGGLIMVGTKGGIWHNGMRPNSPMLYPTAKWNEYKTNASMRVPKTLPRVKNGIQGDWMQAIRDNKKSCSDFSYSAPLAEVIVLGTLAVRTGKALDWDAKTQTIKGNDAAKALFKIPARKGWRPEDLT